MEPRLGIDITAHSIFILCIVKCMATKQNNVNKPCDWCDFCIVVNKELAGEMDSLDLIKKLYTLKWHKYNSLEDSPKAFLLF